MYTEEEKEWPSDHIPEEKQMPAVEKKPAGDVSVPEDDDETENVGTNMSRWPDITNDQLLEVLNEMRVDKLNEKYEREQLNNKIDNLAKRMSSLEFTVTEALRMIQASFVKIEQAVIACSIGYEKCKQGYEACKEGFAVVEELVEDFPNRIDCSVATGYL